MKNNNNLPSRNVLRNIILESIGKRSVKRKQLIQNVITHTGYTKAQLQDTSSDSLSTRLKSYTGIVINEMIAEKALLLTEDFEIIQPENKIPDDKEIIDIFLKKYLTDDEIKDTSPGGKRNMIKAAMGAILKRKRSEMNKALDVIAYIDEELRKNDAVNNIIKEREKSYPKTPLGNKLKEYDKNFNECKKGNLRKDIYLKGMYKAAMDCISLAGGEFFERLCMSLIKECYGDKVIRDELTAGPGDKGIDGIVFIRDELGFEEKILIQCKTKRKRTAFIPECETRAFLGVMTAEDASKGLMMSNSNYLRETFRFASKVKNLVLIDQKRLIEMMEEYKIGIIKVDGIAKIDEKVFLE